MLLRSLLAITFILPLGATAAESGGHDLSLGLVQLQYQNTWMSSSRFAAEVLYERSIGEDPSPLRLGAGVRGGVPSTYLPLPFDAFLRARLAATLGIWEPAIGPEFGVTGWGVAPSRNSSDPGDWDTVQQQRLGPLYFAFAAAPLRFRVDRWTVSALEFQLGTTFPTLGAGIRIGLGLLSVGYRL